MVLHFLNGGNKLKLKILIVEDNRMLNHNINILLKKEGYIPHSAFSCDSAVEMSKVIKPHIILLDMMLPDGLGCDIIDALNQGYRPRIIIISALSDIKSKNQGYYQGADDYIIKPFDINELLFKIKAIKKRIVNETTEYNIGDIVFNKNTDELMCSVQKVVLARSQSIVLSELCSLFINDGNRDLQMTSNEKRSLENAINRIRKSLEFVGSKQVEIVTNYGCGYRLAVNDYEKI